MAANNDRVCIIWRTDKNDPGIRTLEYKPSGEVRTYDKDHVDPRVGDFTLVSSYNEMIELLKKADGTRLAVPLKLARYFGKDWRFVKSELDMWLRKKSRDQSRMRTD